MSARRPRRRAARCHCGARALRRALPVALRAHCHCESCRRAHGAAFVTWIGFPSPQVRDRRKAPTSSPRTNRRRARAARSAVDCGTQALLRVGAAGPARRTSRSRRSTSRSTARPTGTRVLRRARELASIAGRDRAVTIPRADVTGIVLAGGRAGGWAASTRGWSSSTAGRWSRTCSSGSRRRSARSSINANQNVERYAAFGYPVVADAVGGFAGPLAGLHAGMTRARDAVRRDRAVRFAVPAADLVARLAAALARERARSSPSRRRSTSRIRCSRSCDATCCRISPRSSTRGGRKIDAWYAALRVVEVQFDDEADAFRNINTQRGARATATRSSAGQDRTMNAPKTLRELSCADDYDPELDAGRQGARADPPVPDAGHRRRARAHPRCARPRAGRGHRLADRRARPRQLRDGRLGGALRRSCAPTARRR